MEGVLRSEDARRRARDAHGPLGRGHGARVHARPARRADARPLHAIRRLFALRLARRALRHRAHADATKASGIRWAARAPCRVALAKLARELGVEFRTGTEIEKILSRGGEVTGVLTDAGEEIALRAVVSNCDSVRTHRELHQRRVGANFERRRKYEPACSGVVLYLGLNKRYEHLAHHDFVFSRDPHEEFDFIYKKGEPAPDPTCYLAATTCTEPGTAPPGGEALYVLVHTPYLRPHHDWKRMLPAYRRVIIEKLKRTGKMPDIESRIVFERTLTPQDIHDRYHVLNGAIYGLASHGKFLGAFKPGNRSPDLRGLYLAGGAAHPGPGMPMVLMSGWIAADTLDRDTAGHAVARTGDRRMKIATREKPAAAQPHVSAGVRHVFSAYSRRYVRRHFHAFRILKSGQPQMMPRARS